MELAIKEGLYDIVEDDQYSTDNGGGAGGGGEARSSGGGGDAEGLAGEAEGARTAALMAPRLLSTRKGLSLRVAAFDPDDSSMKMPKLFKPTDPDFSSDHLDN